MQNVKRIRKAYDYLVERAQDGRPFSRQELAQAANWTLTNAKTNLSKRLSEFVREDEEGTLFALPIIGRVDFEDFQKLFGQKQRLFADYTLQYNPSVLVYEFFMPLAQEVKLRKALDNLFYRDTLEQRIREIGPSRICQGLALPASSSDEEIKNLVLDFFDNNISGYSIYTVQGRFRAGALASRLEAANSSHSRYLIDETTAVIRFILPVDSSPATAVQGSLFEPPPLQMAEDTEKRAEQMHWLFLNFFAEAVVPSVSEEQEVWLLESGMRHALYRWVRRPERRATRRRRVTRRKSFKN